MRAAVGARGWMATMGTGIALAAFGPAALRADVIDTRGMAPHEQCAYCHGLDGNSAMARFPRLAGQSAAYLKKQLADFKHGRRSNDGGAMSGIAETLSAADLEAIVRHFAAQTLRASPASAEAEAAAGRRLYFEGRKGVPACASCHGAPLPVLAGAPRLVGQHGAYVEKQLDDFRRGARRNDAQGLMSRIARTLEAHEVRALAQFLDGAPVMTGARQ